MKREERLQKVAENKTKRPIKPPTTQRTITVELPASGWVGGCPACKAKKCLFCGGPK